MATGMPPATLSFDRDVLPWLQQFLIQRGYGSVTLTLHDHHVTEIDYGHKMRTPEQLKEDMRPVRAGRGVSDD